MKKRKVMKVFNSQNQYMHVYYIHVNTRSIVCSSCTRKRFKYHIFFITLHSLFRPQSPPPLKNPHTLLIFNIESGPTFYKDVLLLLLRIKLSFLSNRNRQTKTQDSKREEITSWRSFYFWR